MWWGEFLLSNGAPTPNSETSETPFAGLRELRESKQRGEIVQVAGLWGYTATLTSVSGGGCVGQLVLSLMPIGDTGTMQVTQQGSSLEAVGTSDSGGTVTRYAGNRRNFINCFTRDRF